ncbi:hypothetical protein [Streptomyces sp. NPDC001380]|uniref:hypothetical protein n=1 Tax=Streptomyces sp. NPDC001380 TaxID=3364566 RepID=UPI0036990299
MNTAPHLRPEDRPDFERVLDEALHTDAVRHALRTPGAPLNAEQLRTRALAAAAGVADAAAGEYGLYTALRDRVRESAAAPRGGAGGPADGRGAGADGAGAGAVPVMGVLAPILAWAAALIFLLLGYGLRAADPDLAFARSLVTAGWVSLAVGAVAMVAGIVGLLLTALRDGSTPPDGQDPELYAELAGAKDAWRTALRDRGVVPYLLSVLDGAPGGPEAPAGAPGSTGYDGPAGPAAGPGSGPGAAAPGGVSLVRERPRLGFTSPGFTSPGPEPTPGRVRGDAPGRAPFSSPDYSRPSFSSPEFSSPDFAGPDFTGPDFTSPDFTSPDYDGTDGGGPGRGRA